MPDAGAEFNAIIDSTLAKIRALADRIDPSAHKTLTVFVDPIDGTREFATAQGEYVTILMGFNDAVGHPAEGIMYRPLTEPVTWAAGAASEDCVMGELDMAAEPKTNGMLVTDGKVVQLHAPLHISTSSHRAHRVHRTRDDRRPVTAPPPSPPTRVSCCVVLCCVVFGRQVSPFISQLIDELGYERVPSVASGNRAMMLLEGKGGAYIRDTGGFAKWDTSAPQAVLEVRAAVSIGRRRGVMHCGRSAARAR